MHSKMIKLKVEMDACVNLPSSWEKQVVSVDPSGCIILYADQDCRGFRKRLDKWSFGSSNLRDIAFESKLSSISTCPKKPTIPDEDEL
ncbi:hypothetical protein Ocin01_09434 [Orchesella cincta]|uniref:Uncharacterized protein n=1 Tax=Orchesella cincta TaxID=48709 RepID=A0A1D2MW23_ORCCI|nr:hypothetical protein Ocin01_09434 [Orchesella cincta]